ncbi:MucR family transcriptional regulator [Paramagnetospirillum magneticum]|uniref:Transcriptional regulatory protein ros n=1 Tax=Paramagnetospirillum magneticum (strain ATCC 700264 / AMB-1) TaxID=342108 RepID=Q2W224_PARM1|nr:MucR family transcriptional regulator [Paramagnetospirillum magneticum]BAE52101.1 Transcriptional regulatory protein ros [Paramagnetospirillum magneticum AMB-1]
MVDQKMSLAARIAAAYLRNHEIPITDLPELIKATYAALAGTDAPPSVDADRPIPAVPIKKSITPDAVTCLECGKKQMMLRRHLLTSHGLSVDAYRSKWALPADYPMAAPNYSQKRSEMAIQIGLGRKPKAAAAEASSDTAGAEKAPHTYPASRWAKPTG